VPIYNPPLYKSPVTKLNKIEGHIKVADIKHWVVAPQRTPDVVTVQIDIKIYKCTNQS